MGVKITLFSLFIIVTLFIVGCISKPEIEPSVPAIYIVSSVGEEPQIQTFIVGEEDPLAWLDETKTQRHELNTIRSIREDEDNQEEFEIKSKLKNVVRSVDNELIIGYDEELDNPRWVEVES